jgi:hypothetical protein
VTPEGCRTHKRPSSPVRGSPPGMFESPIGRSGALCHSMYLLQQHFSSA